tara:strand:- start:72 stop:458 length:387 start_codon:yes stop_codon:yes gene_type:complete
MSFDSHSLDRLRELGRKLPQKLPKADAAPNKESTQQTNLHQVETEENPQQLFHSLMDISPNGSVPSHLVTRLKEIEAKELSKTNPVSFKDPTENKQISSNETLITNSRSIDEENSLYTSFKSLLLEED